MAGNTTKRKIQFLTSVPHVSDNTTKPKTETFTLLFVPNKKKIMSANNTKTNVNFSLYGRLGHVSGNYFFNVQGYVHRKYILIYNQQDATLHSLFISGNCSTCAGGTSTHHQELTQLYLQHLALVKP